MWDSKKVKEWLEKHESRMKVTYLPTYSPELNPDEYLNNHLKKEMRKRGHARSQEELENRARSLSDIRDYVIHFFLILRLLIQKHL